MTEGSADVLDLLVSIELVDDRVIRAIAGDGVFQFGNHQCPALAAARSDQCIHPKYSPAGLHPAGEQGNEVSSGLHNSRDRLD